MKVGLIGGYGLQNILKDAKMKNFKAKYKDERINGKLPEYQVIYGNLGDKKIVIIPRHGRKHQFPPHSVPFKSYFDRMEEEGVDAVITTNSVGVMKKKYSVPSLFLIENFVNEGEEVTYYDIFENEPAHASMSEPYDPELRKSVLKVCERLGIKINRGAVYVNSQGPRLETKAEVKNKYSRLGDIIGMTGAKEAILANEKGLPIASIGMGVNWAEGIEGPVKIEDIKARTEEIESDVHRIISKAVSGI